jgi:hypothetical protein
VFGKNDLKLVFMTEFPIDVVNPSFDLLLERFFYRWALSREGCQTGWRDICNEEDPFTYEAVEDIARQYRFVFSNASRNKFYGCDVRQLGSYIATQAGQLKNPFTGELLGEDVISRVSRMLNLLGRVGEGEVEVEGEELDVEKRMQLEIVSICGEISRRTGFTLESSWFRDPAEIINRLADSWKRLSVVERDRVSKTLSARPPRGETKSEMIYICGHLVRDGESDSDKFKGCMVVVSSFDSEINSMFS